MSQKKPKNLKPVAPVATPAAAPAEKAPTYTFSTQPKSDTAHLPFGKENFLHVGIGIGLVILGYILMAGEEFKDAKEFSLALNVSPFFTVGGYLYILYGILRRSKKKGDA